MFNGRESCLTAVGQALIGISTISCMAETSVSEKRAEWQLASFALCFEISSPAVHHHLCSEDPFQMVW